MYKPKHFSPCEFHCNCKCGAGYEAMHEDCLKLIDEIREKFGGPLHVNSSIRCKPYNQAVGGATKSYHLKGMACDLSPEVQSKEHYERLKNIADDLNPKGGVGFYPDNGFVHIDCRGSWSRWTKGG